MRVTADSILQLATSFSCSILRLPQDLPAGFDMRLTYTLIYPVNLRTYSAKYNIFIVCFRPADFSYHSFKL